jgi:hypothetical protein
VLLFRPEVAEEDHELRSQNGHYPIQYLNQVHQMLCYCCLVAMGVKLAELYVRVVSSIEGGRAITRTFKISDLDKDLNRI